MKVAIFNWRDIGNPLSGGAEIATHEIAKRLVAAGHKITQFSANFAGGEDQEIIDGVEIFRSGTSFTIHFKAFFFYQKYLKGKVDLVIDQIHGIPFFTPLYVVEPKLAYIHEVAGPIWFWEWLVPVSIVGFVFERLYFALYRKILFITVSESTKKDLINYGIHQKNIKVIKSGFTPPSVDISKISKEKNPTIIYLGRLYRAKRIEEAIKGFKIVQLHYPNSKLWIVGTGKKNYQNFLKKRAKRLRLNKNITFYGFVKEYKKFELLTKSWAIVATSVKEGWGLTIVEAGACSTPAVVYNVGGLRDAVKNNKTGLICQQNSPENLAENILKLIRSENLRNQLGKDAENFASGLNWEKTAKKFNRIITQIVKAS